MTIESRSSWGARASRGTSALSSTKGVKAHYTGGHVTTATLTDHEACRAAVRGIQNGHMDGHGWNDIGYSMIACSHAGIIGRGPHVLPAANGAGLNSAHYAILCLVGTSGVSEITDEIKTHFHECRNYLISHGEAGAQIKGHRDGYATDCPGPSVYPWIQAGAPLPTGPAFPPPPTTPDTEDTPMEYAAFGLGSAYTINRGEWVNVPWDTEYSDPTNVHSATGTSVLAGFPCVYAGAEFTATFSGLAEDDVVMTRLAEYQYNAGPPPADVLMEAGLEASAFLTDALSVHHVGSGKLQEGRKLRAQVFVPAGAGTVQIVHANIHVPFTR